ncbi:MAG: hypothetical protein IKI38_00580 [Mogibacterium sp.]|nr:hypothetical protein [Mogibacterium sp.]
MNKSRVALKTRLAEGVYKITFDTDDCKFKRPGQFAMIEVGGKVRPFPVCDYDSRRFSVVFRTDGEEGMQLLNTAIGAEIGTLTGLGNGFDVDAVPDGTYIVADGAGVAEMLELARALLTRGKEFKAVLGYPSKNDIYMVDSYRMICNEIEVLTLDGSNGREGMAADVIRDAGYVCASGSLPMLKKLVLRCSNGQFSLSNQMLSTAEPEGELIVPTNLGATSSINDGPVYDKNDIKWNELDN